MVSNRFIKASHFKTFVELNQSVLRFHTSVSFSAVLGAAEISSVKTIFLFSVRAAAARTDRKRSREKASCIGLKIVVRCFEVQRLR